MASRASSDTGGRIPRLPRLGTSWYARGPGYWARRVAYTLFLVGLLAGVCAVSFALYRAFVTSLPAGARSACDAAEAVLGLAGVAWGWVAGRRKVRAACEEARGVDASWNAHQAAQRRAPGLASAGRGLILIATPVLPALMAAATAYCLALILVGESPDELGARREMAAHGHPAYPAGTSGPTTAERT